MILKKYHVILIVVLIMAASCHTIKVNTSTLHTAGASTVTLGVIGIQEGNVLNTGFRATTIPVYKKPIRVGVNTTQFNATTYKAYLQTSKTNIQQIHYVDSIETKPQFMTLELLDQVTVVSELEKEHNTQTIEYLKHQKDAHIITAISIALPARLMEEIIQAEAVFLTNENYKQYGLSLVRKGKSYKTIDFAVATALGYRLSYFCWGENDKNRITIFDITDESDSCPKNTYRNANKAKEKTKYLKL